VELLLCHVNSEQFLTRLGLIVCRDALIASIIDGVRASGNRDVHVKMRFTNRGHRLG